MATEENSLLLECRTSTWSKRAAFQKHLTTAGSEDEILPETFDDFFSQSTEYYPGATSPLGNV